MTRTPESLESPRARVRLYDTLAQIHGGSIPYEEEKDSLIELFQDSINGQDDMFVAVPIISTIARFGSSDDMPLLKQGLAKERAYGIKLAAEKAIREIQERTSL